MYEQWCGIHNMFWLCNDILRQGGRLNFKSSDRYKSGSSSLMQNVNTKPKHVAGSTPNKVQSLETLSTVS